MPLLDTARLRFLAIGILAVSLVLLVMSFVTSGGSGRTSFGTELGADYAGFYTAGHILNEYPAVALYDTAIQDRIHHELHPHLPAEVTLPFVHPPFVAVAFWPLALLPYAWSFAVWLVISLGLYLAGLIIALRMLSLSPGDKLTALLLALSFEPFVMECWQGGQLSAFGFCCFAVALALNHAGGRFSAGLVLGLCLYKPTLLVVVVPVLIVARRWQTLLGIALTGLVLAVLTLAAVGWDGSKAFVDKLLGFSTEATQSGGLELRTWKYVDLNAFTRLLLGGPGRSQRILFLLLALPPFAMLLVRAWSLDGRDERYRRLVWAAVLLATPVLNLYVGIYDSVLVVLGALLLVDALSRPNAQLQSWLVALYVAPWLTQPLARHFHLQIFTLVLLGLVTWTCIITDRKYT